MKIRTFLPALALLLVALSPAQAAAGRQFLRHRLAALTAGTLQPVDRLPATNQLQAAICLPLRNQPALTNLLREIANPASPNYRRYLTPEQFAEQFGPTKADYEAVVAYARAQGLTVTTLHPNRLLVDVSGSAADFERAFHISLQRYRHPRENRTFHAPDAAPSVDLAVPVLSVCGLDNYAVPKPAGMRPRPADAPRPQAGSGPSGYLMGYDYRHAYAPGVTLTGAGQSVGLLQFDSYYAADIAAYVSQAGLPSVPVQKVLIDGFSGTPGVNNAEVAMDIEMAISMAPGLDRVLVYAAGITAPAIDILNRMATDNTCKQLSASWTWGTLEPGTEQVFQQFAAQGQSYFNASGDSDAYTGRIDAPADDPYITIVGGTTLTTGSSATWSSETVWNWGGGTGSGGGISTTYAIPSWQQGMDMTASHGSTTMRNIPDVAMAADDIWVIYGNGKSGAFGGTSAAAPLWAGFTALINEQAVARGLGTVGFLNPAVYAIGAGSGYTAAFHDITTGDNTSSTSPSKFYAVSGYDLCTGWGTPNGQGLIDALTGPPEPLGVTPTGTITASGPVGGPFSVEAQTYTLTNSGASPLNWSCATTAPWLSVSASSGTLPPGGSDRVTASLNITASNLANGAYNATVRFTDLDTAAVQTRAFQLRAGQPLVENGDFETGNFSGWTQSGNTAYSAVSASPSYVHSGSYGAYFGPSGSLGYLGQTVATIPGECYTLSFWLNSPNGSGPNEFLARWNGFTLFDQTNLGAIGWTNLVFTVCATGTTSTLQFGFRDDPSYLSLDDVSLTALTGTNAPVVVALTVQSALGGASPGSTLTPSGNTLYQQILNSPVGSGGTQYVCTGAAVTGNDFTQTTPTNVTLTLTNNATLTWNWQGQFRLTTAVSGSGTVTPGGWKVAGTTVVLTATAGSSAHFVSWSGNTSGCTISNNVLTAPMTQARSITATFAAGAQPVISGRVVKNGTSTGVAGVLLTFSNGGGTATTDAGGNYSRTMPYSWTGTVTPSAATGAFSPTTKSYSKLVKSKTGQNFKWLPPPVISGKVTRSGTSTGAAGITLTFSGVGTATTDASGNYSMTVPYRWTGTATPSSGTGGTFSPTYKSYSGLTANKSSQNYSWTTPAALPQPQASAPGSLALAPTVLLRTFGSVRWSGADAEQVRKAGALLAIDIADGKPTVTLPLAVATPGNLSASVVVEPALRALADPAAGAVVLRNGAGGIVATDTLLPGATVLGSVTLLPLGGELVLTWDLTVIGP